MDAAFDKLTIIQKVNINKQMFAFAYCCVVKSKGDDSVLSDIILQEDAKLQPDIMRYCKLAKSVM